MILWDITSAGVVPPPHGWLSRAERDRLELLSVAKRREDWLLGRLSAKRLVRHLWAQRDVPPPPDVIEIAAHPSGAPFARLAPEAAPLPGLAPGEPFPVVLSISHSGGTAFSAAAFADEVAGGLGADLERIEARSAGFLADFFTRAERALVYRSEEPEVLVTALWSAKEAALKALGIGLTADTRDVVCTPGSTWTGHLTHAWEPFAVEPAGELAGRAHISGSWRRLREFVLTIAETHPAGAPAEAERHHELHPQPV